MNRNGLEDYHGDTEIRHGNILKGYDLDWYAWKFGSKLVDYSDKELLDAFFETRHQLIWKDYDFIHNYKHEIEKGLPTKRISIDLINEPTSLLMMSCIYAKELRNRNFEITGNGEIYKNHEPFNYKIDVDYKAFE